MGIEAWARIKGVPSAWIARSHPVLKIDPDHKKTDDGVPDVDSDRDRCVNYVLPDPTYHGIAVIVGILLELVVPFIIVVQLVHDQLPIHVVALDHSQQNV